MAKNHGQEILNQLACLEAGIAYSGSSYNTENLSAIDDFLFGLSEADRVKAKRKFRKLWRKAFKANAGVVGAEANVQIVIATKIGKSTKRMLAIREARSVFDKKHELI